MERNMDLERDASQGGFFGSKTGLMQNQFSHVFDLRYVYNKTKYEYKGTWKAFFSVLSIFAVEKYDAHLTLNSLPIPLAGLWWPLFLADNLFL